jgi:hypothetical protein
MCTTQGRENATRKIRYIAPRRTPAIAPIVRRTGSRTPSAPAAIARPMGKRSTSALVPVITHTNTRARRPREKRGSSATAYHRRNMTRCSPSKGARARSVGSAKGRLCVDHCHVTGMIRGLLCNECNGALGYLKDDQASLVAALAYLGALPRDEPGSAAQRALAVHHVLPPWPTRRAILTYPPSRRDATPRACGIGGRTSAKRPTSRGGAVLPADSVHPPSEGDDVALEDAPTTSPMRTRWAPNSSARARTARETKPTCCS